MSFRSHDCAIVLVLLAALHAHGLWRRGLRARQHRSDGPPCTRTSPLRLAGLHRPVELHVLPADCGLPELPPVAASCFCHLGIRVPAQ